MCNYSPIIMFLYKTTSSIEKRTVKEIYMLNASSQECSFKSKLWLISDAELGLLNGETVTISEDEEIKYSDIKACGIGNITGTTGGYGADWWIRSPYYLDDDM